jgi:polyhydroxyalkanoate synthesis regulator phasin
MQRSDILEMVDEMIDCEGPVTIGNLTFYRSDIVRKCDPIAYRMMVNEIIDSQIEDLQYDLDRTDDEDEIEELKERIAELEDFSL